MQNDVWQVKVKGKVYECQFQELEQWIADRALLPEDEVRRDLRGWIKAGHLPALRTFFDAISNPNSAADLKTTTNSSPAAETFSHQPEFANNNGKNKLEPKSWTPERAKRNFSVSPAAENCQYHPSEPTAYVCRACNKGFCKSCPKSYGAVRICPACGEMCHTFTEVQTKLDQTARRTRAQEESYGIKDFLQAWSYPFKFWPSLCVGALFVAFLSFFGFFGDLLAYIIVFGCTAKTINRIASGNTEESFMADYDNLWDDVIKPVFLGAGILFVACCPIVVLFLVFPAVMTLKPLGFILLAATVLWSIFYWPMAVMIAGYTRSFRSTINPLIGINAMRRMGRVYVAAFFFSFPIYCSTYVFKIFLESGIANSLLAGIIFDITFFYLSIVIAFILGSALYKSADRLDIDIN